MQEVAKQLKPLHEWQLAFWSNGTDRPPGFFQTRIEADDKRYNALIESMEKSRKFWRDMLFKVVVPVLGGILGLIGWGIKEAAPTFKILFEEYVHAHPAVEDRMKNHTANEPSGVLSERPQDSNTNDYAPPNFDNR